MTTSFGPTMREGEFTGMARLFDDADRAGFRPADPGWSNLGQGQPETGDLPGAPPRLSAIAATEAQHAYAPLPGVLRLREAVADHYNRLHRAGADSRYTAANVAIVPGGRAALTRIVTALRPGRVGCLSPDYAAYVDVFKFIGSIEPAPMSLSAAQGFPLAPGLLREHVIDNDLRAFLLSNPSNPTGRVVAGEALHQLVATARETSCALIVDEFYSQYVYDDTRYVSAAAHVEDVDDEPVLIIDGLTKNARYPGWRVAWVVGPARLIAPVVQAGAFCDGGAAHPLQSAALSVLDAEHHDAEADAIRAAFREKRDLVVERLGAMGLGLLAPPAGAFYAFASVAELPKRIRTSQGFFKAGLDAQVLTVPGEYFDLLRTVGTSTPELANFVRISFGPRREEVVAGLNRVEAMIDRERRREPVAARRA